MTSHRPTRSAAILSVTLIAGALTTAPVSAQSLPTIGRVKIATGAAFVVRAGTSLPATPGLTLLETDSLRTGADGRLGVSLNDDTRISLGPDSEARLTRYRYAPADGALALVLNFIRGAAVYASGQIAKLSPDAVRLETPAAIVGVRGTTVALRVVPK
jgi:hypothetical protein